MRQLLPPQQRVSRVERGEAEREDHPQRGRDAGDPQQRGGPAEHRITHRNGDDVVNQGRRDMSDVLISERTADHVHRLTLNRPDQLNTMTAELCGALHAELANLSGDRSCRAIVLTGAGRGFCAGVDLRGYGQAPGNDGSDPVRDQLGNQEHMSSLILRLRATPQPVIAAINGPAAGFGLALALGSDIRYAARSAVLRVAYINTGASNCDMGTSWLLPRLIGASRAHELMLTGRRVDADEAERIGLVADVVDDERLMARALEGAAMIAAWAPWAARATKQGMWTALEIPSQQAGIEYEDRQQMMLIQD